MKVIRIWITVVLCLAMISFSACGDDVQEVSVADLVSPTGGPPALPASRGPLDGSAKKALAGALKVAVQDLEISVSVSSPDSFFAIVESPRTGDLEQVSGSRRAGDWSIEIFSAEGLGTSLYEDRPPAGSGGTVWGGAASREDLAWIGFVDETMTRVEILGPGGQLLDATSPTAEGAIALLTEPWSQVRLFRDRRFMAATLISEDDSMLAPADDSARAVGERFVSALQSGDIESARSALAATVPSDLVLPLLKELIVPLKDRKHHSELHGPIVRIRFEGLERTLLDLYFTQEGEDLRVLTYSMGNDPRA